MNVIQKKRGLKQLNQTQFAKLCGVSRPYIAHLEYHIEDISPIAAQKIAKVLDCSPFEIMAGHNYKLTPTNDEERLIEISNLVNLIENVELKTKLKQVLGELKCN